MKFQSVVVGTALVLATMNLGSAFVPSSAVQMRQTFAAKNPALNMVATEPEVIVNGETKPRRTREVRKLVVSFQEWHNKTSKVLTQFFLCLAGTIGGRVERFASARRWAIYSSCSG